MSDIRDARDYAIRKGRVLEKFSPEFFTKYQHEATFNSVYQSLIRDADPYFIIEQLIEMNSNTLMTLKDMVGKIGLLESSNPIHQQVKNKP